MHLNSGFKTKIKPQPREDSLQKPPNEVGLFSSRSPHRPNPVALSALQVVSVNITGMIVMRIMLVMMLIINFGLMLMMIVLLLLMMMMMILIMVIILMIEVTFMMSSMIYSCLHYYSIGGYVVVNGLDLIEDTPIIDIKPYIPAFDSFPEGKYIDNDDDDDNDCDDDDCDGNYDDNC